jgi:transcription antitermination factor NusG
MEREREIKEITAQLRKTHINQEKLIWRLERLSEGTTAEEQKATNRKFAIGDQVRVRNPGLFKQTKGRIIKIGEKRITVL